MSTFLVEAMESRVLLTCDPNFAGVNIDASMQATAHNLFTESSQFLGKVQTWIYDTALGTQLPIIGAPFKGLKGTSQDLLQPLINKLNDLSAQIDDFSICGLLDRFETALAQPPQPPPAPGEPEPPALPGNEFNVAVLDDLGSPWQKGKPIAEAYFDMRLRGALVDTTFHPNFNLGLPVLGLKLNGGLNVGLTYDIHLVVGMDSHGIYLNLGSAETQPEAKLEFSIKAQPGLVFEGTLGFLRVKAVDAGTANDPGTGLTADLFIDLQDGPDPDTKLRLTEIPQLGLGIFKEVGIQGNARVNMLTTLDLGSANFPGLSANLVLDWNFPRTNLLAPAFGLSQLGTPPLLMFKNVTLDAGTFMSQFLSPVLKAMNNVLDPIRPVIHALQTRVPLLTDIDALRLSFDRDLPGQPGYGEVSILEVLQVLLPNDDFVKFFVAAKTLDNLVGRGAVTLPSDTAKLNFGNFLISGDPRKMAAEQLHDPGIISGINTILPTLPIELGSTIQKLKNPDNFGSGQAGFKFPILDNPVSIVGLFLGQPVNLVTYVTPRLDIGPAFERTFNVFGPLAVRLAGGIMLHAQFGFGFDTFGFQSFAADGYHHPEKIFDGFYISDRATPTGEGADVDELVVNAAVEAGFGVNVGVASVFINGGIKGMFTLNLNDPNNDGKVRPSELFDMVKDGRWDCIFDSHGTVSAGLSVIANLLFIHAEFHVADFKILDLSYHCVMPGTPVLPDLVGSDLSFTSPNNGADPHLRGFTLAVANRGTAPAGASVATIYLSDDNQITTADVPLKAVNLGPIAAAGIQSVSGEFTLPKNPFETDNQYYIGVLVDSTNAVAESDETNNANTGEGTGPSAFAVETDLPSPSPTVASQVQVNATAILLDKPTDGSLIDEFIGPQDVDIYKFVVSGAGGAPIGIDVDTRFGIDTYLRLYDAEWNLIAQNDDGLAPAEGVSAGGESYVEAALEDGTYYAVVSAAGNNTGDPRLLSGRGNPTALKGPYVITVLSDPHALPDLVTQGFTATGTWTPSTNYRFVTLTIGNEGTADAGRFLVQYFVSDDPEITAADALVGASVVQGVPEGTSVDVNETIDLGGVFGADDPLRTDNEYFLGAIVNTDPRRGVVEAHTYNNSNRGLGVDSIKISSEADLPIPANGTVIARPIPASRFGESRISELGDEYIGAYDMDVWSFPITEPGIRARLYVRGQGTFQSSPLADPYLRLYDENWTPLAANDNGVPPDAPAGSPIGSYIEEVFPRAGTYYAVVSTPPNANADPRTLVGRSAGPKGGYSFTLTVYPFPEQPLDLHIQSFTSASPAWSPVQDVTAVIVNGFQDANQFDINYYLSDDLTITTGDVLLKSTHVNGLVNELRTINERLTLPADVMLGDNQYYLGILLDPDQRVFKAFDQFLSVPIVADAHLPSPSAGDAAVSTPLGFDAPQAATLGFDEWVGPYDVDTFSFTAAAGQTVSLDVDSTRLDLIERLDRFILDRGDEWTMEQLDQAVSVDSYRDLVRQFGRELPFTLAEVRAAGNLDSFVRLYDANWNLLAGNDDRQGADDALVLDDPYLTYTFAADGTYYAVVSSSDSAGNNPRSLADRQAGSTQGAYALILHDLGGLAIQGSVFDDVNADGVRGKEEAGLAGVAVYLDADNNGVLDPGETSTLTGGAGLWAIGGLAAGAYSVRAVDLDGYAITAPSGGVAVVLLDEGSRPRPIPFGETRLATLSGLSFHDLNADGLRRRGEIGLAGRLVYADLNNNSAPDAGEPRALTDDGGSFELKVLTGRYLVREALPTGWRGTAPAGGAYEVAVEGGGGRTDLLFGSVQTASVSGKAFNDLSGDGVWDGDEPALSDRTVFIDQNGNGVYDPGEPAAVTTRAGQYRFADLLPGTCDVAQVLPADWYSTTPASGHYVLTLAGGDAASATAFGSRFAPATVAGRAVFYNHSAYDGNDAAPGAADDAAIATDKLALLPGSRSPTFQNYTSFSRGLNGVMIDVARLPADQTLTGDDFVFMTGDGSDASRWLAAPAPSSVTVRRGAGAGGSDRVSLVWPDGAIRNTWLHVTMKANQHTGLRQSDLCSFGNLVGETGDAAATARVSALDLSAVKRAINTNSLLTGRFDFNRDGRVNALDLSAVRANLNRSLSLATSTATAAASADVGGGAVLAESSEKPAAGVLGRSA